MNISEFAEKIVFSNSLEEKLAPPGRLTFDRNPSGKLPSMRSLRTPGRPSHLLMQHEPGKNHQPPRDDQLENEKSRGQLLHFLANHELLATELMALVLLKFPDAPRAFRQGVLVTLQEEQLHTRMYLKRMRECGVEFGAWPVSGQFWRMVEPMQTPMEFVSRLSLTFEQANLDYSRHFASVFKRIGDDETSSLLNQIYEDEISHVKHGLDWFRQWKDPDQSDFDAWKSTLTLPMSPARARGPRSSFNREGRRLAGLSEEFIDSVEVFGQSKDRSATLRWFDPSPESELAGVKDTKVSLLAVDLEHLCVAMAKPDDVILVRNHPSRELCKHWLEAGIELPEFCTFEDVKSLEDRKLNRCEPWALTPTNQSIVQPIRESFRHAPPLWDERQAELFRKSWGANALARWESRSQHEWMSGKDCLGIVVGDKNSLSQALSEIAGRGFSQAIYKPDLSSSGRGVHRIETIDLHVAAAKEKASGVVEPLLDRLVDLSFLWNLSPTAGPRFLGWTRQLISKGGRYSGTCLGSPFFDCESEIRRFLLADRCEKLRKTVVWLEQNLLPELAALGFSGNVGVDAFVYRDATSGMKMRPFVELNPRTTMGHVALSLEKRVSNLSKAEFQILTRSEFVERRDELDSVPLEFASDGRWRSGVVWLSERKSDAMLIPCVVVSPRKKHEP